MEGTHDLEKIILWLQIIGSIYAYATTMKYDDVLKTVIGLNTTSQYNAIVDLVFGRFSEQLKYPGSIMDIEDGVLNLKYSLSNPAKMSFKLPANPPAFDEFFNNVNTIDGPVVVDNIQRRQQLLNALRDQPINVNVETI
jgi:hypothetical protein